MWTETDLDVIRFSLYGYEAFELLTLISCLCILAGEGRMRLSRFLRLLLGWRVLPGNSEIENLDFFLLGQLGVFSDKKCSNSNIENTKMNQTRDRERV